MSLLFWAAEGRTGPKDWSEMGDMGWSPMNHLREGDRGWIMSDRGVGDFGLISKVRIWDSKKRGHCIGFLAMYTKDGPDYLVGVGDSLPDVSRHLWWYCQRLFRRRAEAQKAGLDPMKVTLTDSV